MKTRIINGECLNCESSYQIEYIEELASAEYPEFCPFCGEHIDEITEEHNDDDDEGSLDSDYDEL